MSANDLKKVIQESGLTISPDAADQVGDIGIDPAGCAICTSWGCLTGGACMSGCDSSSGCLSGCWLSSCSSDCNAGSCSSCYS